MAFLLEHVMTTEESVWRDIKARCNNPNDTTYESNGAKGIAVCAAWNESFDSFLLDMGRKPFVGAVLGRIDKTIGYSPENCRWMTKEDSQLNKTNMVLTWNIVNEARKLYKTTDITYKKLSEKFNVSVEAISNAISHYTWHDDNYEYVRREIGGKKCSMPGCDRKYHSNGYCAMHKTRMVKHGSATWEPAEKIKTCKIPGCAASHFAKGYCRNHYEQKRRNGETIEGTVYQKKENIKLKTKRENKRDLPEYKIWDAMIQRCTNENNQSYRKYGGRGIVVCERWRNSFTSFYKDIGPRPFPEAQIDRIDNDGNYEPGNCRWVSSKINNRNKNSNVLTGNLVVKMVSMRGNGMTYMDISKALNVKYENVRSVLSRGAWG